MNTNINMKNQNDDEADYFEDYYQKKGIADKAIHIFLGNEFYDIQKYEDAVKMYDKVIECNPLNADAYESKGCALRDLHEYDEALEQFDKAIELDPLNASAYCKRSTALRGLQRYEEAIEMCEKAIEIDPLNADAYLEKGGLLGLVQRFEQSFKMYEKEIEINPLQLNAQDYKNLSLFYHLRKYISLYPLLITKIDKAYEIDHSPLYPYYKEKSLLQLNQKQVAEDISAQTQEIQQLEDK